MITIDISKKGVLNVEHTKLLNQVGLEIRAEYNDLIHSLVSKPDSPYQWASPLFSRNTIEHYHELFPKLVHLAFIKQLLVQQQPIDIIITDSHLVASILKKNETIQIRNIQVQYHKPSLLERLKYFWYFRLEYFAATFEIIKRFILTKIYPSKNLLNNSITLSEVSILHNSFENNQYHDRYYANFGEIDQNTTSIYLPNFIVKSSSRLIQIIRNSKQFLLKEDFLKWNDYVRILSYPLHKHKILKDDKRKLKFRGFDVFTLIQEEYWREWGTHSALNALLNYFFIKRLSTYPNLDIRLFITWFENQSINKTFNLALNQFMPQITNKGYQVSILDNKYYLCFYPTKEEHQFNLLPQKIAISGKGFAKESLEFCPEIPYEIAPAFRHQDVWQQRKQYPDTQNFVVLLGLPIILDESIHLIKIMHQYAKNNNNIKVKIKPHPSVPDTAIIQHYTEQIPKSFEFVSGNFHNIIETSHLLITTASSVAVEAIAKGIPVIIIGKLSGLIHNPIPKNISKKIWRLCYTPKELKDAIDYFMNLSSKQQEELQEIGKQVRADYFEPVTPKATHKFLMLDN